MIIKKLSILSLLPVLFLFTVAQVHAVSNPITISNATTSDTVFPQTVADPTGYLHAVWMDVEPGKIWAGHQNPGIFYSRWNGDTWSAPLVISENTGFAELPAITSDTTGTVHAVWDDETYGAGRSRIAYRTRGAGSSGTWSTIEAVPAAAGTSINWNARIAVNGNNVPHVVYDGYGAPGDSIYWTHKGSGSWSTPALVSTNASGSQITDTQWADLRSDASGNLHLIYWSWSQGIFYRYYNGSSWSTPYPVVSTGNIAYTRMVTTPSGEVFVTWFDNNNSSINVRYTQSALWQSAVTLTTLATSSYWGLPIMGITTDSKNRVHVGWGERGADNLIDLRYRSFASGIWASVRDVDLDNNDADSPFVYPDKWDNQHFMWSEKNSTTGRWELKYRVAEGTIQNVTTSGGTVTANPFNITEATLSIPSGALSSTQEIAIQVGPVPENVDPTVVTLPKAYTFRPHGLTFLSPATATIYYTDAELAGADERQLKPWFWNSQTSAWEAQTGTVKTNQNTIDVSLNHFSLYGISAPIVRTTFHSPQKNEVIKQGALLYEFSLKYADGNEILPVTTPEDLVVKLRNSNGVVVKTAQFDGTQIVKDEGKNTYKDNLLFQKDDIPNGDYTLEVYLAGSLMSKQPFTLSR